MGQDVIFASNKPGHDNFELFMVDVEGAKEPVQVTDLAGFDGLPVPSPDGKRLAWTSSRSGAGAGQVFLADWNHAKALGALSDVPTRPGLDSMSRRASVRRGLVLCVALFVFHITCIGAQEHASRRQAHVTALASDAAEGRATGSPGERVASEYIISELRRIGALPLPGLRDYRVPFEFTAGARDGGSSISVTSAGTAASARSNLRNDIQALSFSADDDLRAGRFHGLRHRRPTEPGRKLLTAYANLDVKDKIVVVLRYFPENADPKIRSVLARYSDLRYKESAARQRGARGMVVIAGPRSPNAGAVIPMSFDSAISASGLVAVSIGKQVARALFASPARTLEDAQRALDSGESAVRQTWLCRG